MILLAFLSGIYRRVLTRRGAEGGMGRKQELHPHFHVLWLVGVGCGPPVVGKHDVRPMKAVVLAALVTALLRD